MGLRIFLMQAAQRLASHLRNRGESISDRQTEGKGEPNRGPFYKLKGLFKYKDHYDSGELRAQSKAGRCREAQSGGPCPAL